MTFYQILATRIDWLGFVLIGLLLGELVRALIRLFKDDPPKKERVPFYRPTTPPDPAATTPMMKSIRLDDPPNEWDEQQGRFW